MPHTGKIIGLCYAGILMCAPIFMNGFSSRQSLFLFSSDAGNQGKLWLNNAFEQTQRLVATKVIKSWLT